MGSNLVNFVHETIGSMPNFDHHNPECIKILVKKTIDCYRLKSYEENEEMKVGTIRYLYLYSIVEENLLSKIVEIATNNQILHIEEVYDGHVIRCY